MSLICVAIRVDGDQHREKLRDFLTSDGAALCVRESVDGGNVHFHAVLHTTRKVAAVRMALKRSLGVGGNGDYSVTEVRDLAKYQRYMLKGEAHEVLPEIVVAVGIAYQDPSWIEEQHDAYWAENEELTRKRKAEPVPVVVLQKCMQDHISWDDRAKIARVYIKELVDRDKPINIFSLKSHINLIQCKLCPTEAAIEDLALNV